MAALYDIHGNLPALEAVLTEVRKARVDRIVAGGDVVLGPIPVETLDCLQRFEIPVDFIEGSCDRELLARMRGEKSSGLPEKMLGAFAGVELK
ncbi:MAG: metallophosphoesterase [Gemmatimonadaceae bacterium]